MGEDIIIYGKNIRIYDCDAYTREFFAFNAREQPPAEEVQMDDWTKATSTKFKPVKDAMMKDYL